MVERRKHPRKKLVIKVTYIQGDAFHYYHTRDVSLGGMFLETRRPFPVGTLLDLDFSLPDKKERVEVGAEVVRTVAYDPGNPGANPGMGVAFSRISARDREALADFLVASGDE